MKKLFTDDKFFLYMVLLAVLGGLGYIIGAVTNDSSWNASLTPMILRMICVVALYISYQNHAKNVMKGMMGALLMAQLITALSFISAASIAAERVCAPIFAVLSALLFINHFVINSDRSPSSKAVKFNQIIAILLVINNAVLTIAHCANGLSLGSAILDILGFIGLATVVVCVESRLDAYRIDREAAGWTEEKGYPEGYVHEYEKKDNK